MRNLKNARTSYVVVLRLGSIQDLLDLRRIGDAIARKQQALQRLRGEVSVRTAVRVLRSRLVLGQDPLTAVTR